MSISRLKRAAFAAAAVVIAGCTADSRSPLGPPDEAQPVIADGSRGGPVAGFYFLPPMLKQPVYSGTFDAALSPRVQICELSGTACGAIVAEFTMSGGTGGERVTVSPTAQQYQVNWHTDRFDLDPAKHYRISVSAGTIVLGYADVDVVNSGKELKNVNTGEYIALVDGRTLPIKFRIETAIAATVDVSPDSAQVEPGQTQAFTATVSDLHGNPLPSATVTWSSSDAAVATIDAAGVATGVAAGTATVTARSGAASGSATLRVAVSNTAPVAGADAYQAIGNVTIPVPAPGVLANDTDAEGGSLSAAPGSYATAAGGTVTLAADGSFTYRGAAGFTGEDTFTYTATDGSLTSEATVTVTVPTRVWFVRNDAGAPGDGRDASPFATLKQVEGAAAPGETLLVFAGNGTTAGYDEGIVLKPGQSLTGQGVAADVAVVVNGQTVVLLPAGAAPSLGRTSAGATIRLATDNTVQGVAVSSSQGTGIEGLSFGTLTAGRVSVAASGGPALDLQNGVAAASFTSLSSGASAGAGLRLVNVGGTLSAPGGSLGGAATAAVEIVGGDAAIEYGGGVSAAAGRSVSITGRTGGSVTLSGSLHDTALGIRVENNAGGTVAFTGLAKTLSTGTSAAVTLANNGGTSVLFAGGGLVISTTAGAGFEATGGGTVQVTGAGNTIVSAGGVALRVVDTRSGASGVTFESVSANGGSSGIILRNTGDANGFQVTGTGTAGSGGTVENTAGAAVSLNAVTRVFLNNMLVRNTGESGIYGTGVTDFAFTNGAVHNSGTAGGADASNIAFHSATGSNVEGTVTVAGSTLTQALYHGIDIRNTSGTITTLNLSGNTITSAVSTTESRGAAIRVSAGGSAGGVASITRAAIAGNTISNFPSDAGILLTGGNPTAAGPAGSYGTPGSASQVIAITGNRISGASAAARLGTNAIRVAVAGRGRGNLDISANGTAASPLARIAGTAISVSAFGPVHVAARVTGNHVAPGNSFGSQGIGIGADNQFGTADAPVLDAEVSGNVVSDTDGNGILALARNSAATLRARVTDNTVAAPASGSFRNGIRVDAGSSAGNVSVCLDIAGNAAGGSDGALGIGLRKHGTATAVNAFAVVGMAATATPVVESYVAGKNPAGGGVQLLSASSGFSNCTLP